MKTEITFTRINATGIILLGVCTKTETFETLYYQSVPVRYCEQLTVSKLNNHGYQELEASLMVIFKKVSIYFITSLFFPYPKCH